MNGDEHYAEAERLLVHTDRSVVDQFGEGAERARQQIAAAQAHATLALVAAIAAPATYVRYDGNVSEEDAQKMRDAFKRSARKDGRT